MGHPLETLRREAGQIRRLCDGLKGELERLGGSPSRRRWRLEKPLVSRLAERLSGLGWSASFAQTGNYFIYGEVRPAM